MNETAHTGPVILAGDELGSADAPLRVLHAAALAHARAHFQGRTVVNRATGWEIAFGRAGINKTLHHAAQLDHLQSLPALPALLVRAAWVSREANRDSGELRNVPWVHTFTAELVLAGRPYSCAAGRKGNERRPSVLRSRRAGTDETRRLRARG